MFIIQFDYRMKWTLFFTTLFSLLAVCPSKSLRKKTETPHQECPHPSLIKNGTQLPISNVIDFHKGVTEVKFDGALGKWESKRSCKLKCINGEWVGPLCLEEGVTGEGRFHPLFKSCDTSTFLQKFVLSYKNKTLLNAREFSHGSNVQVRCKEFGVYKLIGDARLICHNGNWKPKIPACIPTTVVNNFTDDSYPPAVMVKVTSGSASIEPTGEVAVYPGSIIHLECLFSRSSGEPEWSWTSTYRTYPTGWSIALEDREWKYRLSIYYTKLQDTGIYTCSTPKGLTHSVIINVLAVMCDATKIISNDPYMSIKVEGSRLGQSILFSCAEGFRLNGTDSITCQVSGVWSGYIPNCLPVMCPTLQVTDPHLELLKQENSYGGHAIAQCPYGFKIIGTPNLLCRDDGTWSSTVPTCKEITCAQPLVPTNGRLIPGNTTTTYRYKVGSTFRFACNNHYQLVGEETIICSETGYWSNPPPFCKIQCLNPGDPVKGHFSPTKPTYDIGERLTLTCSYGYEPSFKSRPRCQRNGTWLEIDVECRPMEKFIFTSTTDKTESPMEDELVNISSTSDSFNVNVSFTTEMDNDTNLIKLETDNLND